jgi:UDP-N-acetylmuramoylalanine--D-glutamate ligase
MKIAIVGFGIEGKASYDYWNVAGNELTIVDEREILDDVPEDAATLLGKGVLRQLNDFDLIIRSPSIHPNKLQYGEKVWSATNEFFVKSPAPVIGVTGTKGKGTTCSLIASILQAAGNNVHLIGNIGKPALAELEHIHSTDIVVYELSSFQLWDLKKSPHVAVVLGIEPDHLDVHTDMEEYIAAKANIALYQTQNDVLIFNAHNDIARLIAENSRAQKIAYPFAISQFADALVIPGEHNVENASAAIAAVREYVQDEMVIRNGLSSFTGLPHRLKFVREVSGVKFYDDSIATTPGSAIAAVRSFDQPKVLILGGSDKGASYEEIVDVCKATNTKVVAIGQTGEAIERLCQEKEVEYMRETGDMTQIVATAQKMITSRGVVILSPASASFDMFKNYADRGDRFIAAVERL